ncbi:hypothetical protein IQ07DRAFT_428269 [Pyrenochaeta sp. DS3sAY3a]|nr:hypothetical protein IQ07DRAFT_428269 [Pyrenochaeta sp. DS3sAY3a]
MGSVLQPLGTVEGIEQGGWPFIDPRMLDLHGAGNLSLAQWPRRDNGRPIMMHMASIAFHYGPEDADKIIDEGLIWQVEVFQCERYERQC